MSEEATEAEERKVVEAVAQELPDVSAEDVAEFLKGSAPLAEAAPSQEAGKEEEPAPFSVPADPKYSPENPTKDAMLEWVLSVSDTSDIELTERDKQVFMRASLHNLPVTLDIPVLGGSVVTCRSLTDYEVDVLYETLYQDQAELGRPMDQLYYFTLLQRYGVAMQIVAVNGRSEPHLRFKFVDKGTVSFREAREVRLGMREALVRDSRFLRESSQKAVNDSSVRTTMLRNALRVFSCKMKVCTEKLASRDFWPPADAG
jgi:hypothetical protein